MCGIAGIVSLNRQPIRHLARKLKVMGDLIAHRGPDGEGVWCAPQDQAGLAHRRLSIIDLSETGAQPMPGNNGTVITQNGEIYNYIELQKSLAPHWQFEGASDTETILACYDHHGDELAKYLRGMFSFAIWDEKRQRMVAARDRFGIKPFYYCVVDGVFYFASEPKALLPFLPEIETDPGAMAQYLTFQYSIDDQTLFKGIKQLMPGHMLVIENGDFRISKYWDVEYNIDFDHSPRYFYNQLRELLDDSIDVHLRADVPIGGYMSGGIDSSLISILAAKYSSANRDFFHGKFTDYPGYDESHHAEVAAQAADGNLHQIDITASDFTDNIEKVIYHLDYPVAGPGSFPQFMVSKLASQHVKVVLGGQGGDELFGGYARYLVAYLEQCLKAALDGNYKNGNYVVTLESILPNLGILREYKPMMQMLWKDNLFGELDERYFRLIDRSNDMRDEVDWSNLDKGAVYDKFSDIFNSAANVQKEAYFDKMTHFDFKCLLPALLQVEDRMSMAHGIESRVPLLDHKLVKFAASIPADVKFKGGDMKHVLKQGFSDVLPDSLLNRRDKMGFPVPLKEWYGGEIGTMIKDVFSSQSAKDRAFINSENVLKNFGAESQFSRKTWGLLSLEIWQQIFHDRSAEWRAKIQ